MVFGYTVTMLRITRLAWSNINNCFCHEPADAVSYFHDASDQAYLSADRGNLTESEQFTALVAEGTSEAKEEEAFLTARFQVKLSEMERRHDAELATLERLNARASKVIESVLANYVTSRTRRGKRKDETTAEDSTISPPTKKKKDK